MDLVELLIACIEAKQGNKELALFYHDPGWSIEIGNPSSGVMLGEASGELSARGNTPEEAAHALLQQLRKGYG